MAKNKKKKTDKSTRLLLETSIQISKFVPDKDGSILRLLPQNSVLYSSHFVLYEFKTGFIRNMVEFYYRVKLLDSPSLALAWWSKKYGKRELKNIHILQAIMASVNKSIPTQDTAKYLRQIEAVIFNLVNNFDTDLLSMVGDFAGDEIVRFKLRSKDDYEPFVDAYNSRKSIPLDVFWKAHIEELKKLLSNKDVFDKSKVINKIYAKLVEIEKDVKNANKYPINKAIGDVVIATDCPKHLTVTTLDSSFSELTPMLGKPSINLLRK
ncbi:MAG TPA: hypothetical protein VGT05_02615 [Patescibacteria group bacterium]|nr:hypothetical protein [Patescibacteria group bacterium]